jgi:hypothetical protein
MSTSGAWGRAPLATLTVVVVLAAFSAACGVLVQAACASEGAPAPAAVAPTPLPAAVGLAYETGTARSPSRVWIAAPSGREPKLLGPGEEPLLAPDGQSVAASVFGANPEQGPALLIYSRAGAAAVPYLSLRTASAVALAWSPDSRYLAVSLQSSAVTNIAQHSGLDVIDTSTGAATTIAHGQIYGASFAPDGSDRIVYGRAPSLSLSAPSNLYISQPDGAGLQALTHDGRSLNPVWGPRYIAYDRERLRRGDAPVYQIWLGSPSGGGAHRLTNLRVPSLVSGLVPMAFSGDGGRLLAEFEGQDTSEAWTVLLSSRRAHRLTVHGQPVRAAGLSRDGRTVLIDQGSFEEPPSRGRVETIPFAGGHAKVLVAHGSQASWNG